MLESPPEPSAAVPPQAATPAPSLSGDAAALWLRETAAALGLVHVAFAPASEVSQHTLYRAWLDEGYAGGLTYLVQDAEARRDPRSLLARARSVLCVAVPYFHPTPSPSPLAGETLSGRIARYARAEDYHLILKRRLNELAVRAAQHLGADVAYRVCVDSAPLLERAVAASAGLGFQGKNTLLITPGVGSYTLLGELLLSVELPVGEPVSPRCGTCHSCIDVCPTGALRDAYRLDARRCISYLTIENPGPIPRELRRAIGTWIFGCDLCQEVCPFNAAERPGDPEFRPRADKSAPELLALLGLGAAQFRRFVKRSALRRIGRNQLLRNVAVALGNAGTPSELPALVQALGREVPLVRQHLVWALGEIGRRHPSAAPEVLHELRAWRPGEPDDAVQDEIHAALGELAPLTA
jgi:epoxyqueuosine reductase